MRVESGSRVSLKLSFSGGRLPELSCALRLRVTRRSLTLYRREPRFLHFVYAEEYIGTTYGTPVEKLLRNYVGLGIVQFLSHCEKTAARNESRGIHPRLADMSLVIVTLLLPTWTPPIRIQDRVEASPSYSCTANPLGTSRRAALIAPLLLGVTIPTAAVNGERPS